MYIFKLELQPQVKDSSHFCTTSSGWNLDIVSSRVLQACDTLRDYQALVFTCFMCGWVIYFIASVLQALFFAVAVSSFQGLWCAKKSWERSVFQAQIQDFPLDSQLPSATPERSGSFTESPLPPLFRFLSAFSPWPLFGDQGGLTDMILRLAGLQQNMRCMNLCNPGIFFILKTKENYNIENNRKCCDIYLYIMELSAAPHFEQSSNVFKVAADLAISDSCESPRTHHGMSYPFKSYRK